VVVDQPTTGEFLRLCLDVRGHPHQTSAIALEETVCLQVDRHHIAVLIERKPTPAWICWRCSAASSTPPNQLVCVRSTRNPNIVIEQQATLGELARRCGRRFGGSWVFISFFAVVLIVYTYINVHLGGRAWDLPPSSC